MAKRLKYKTIDELVDALNHWCASKPNELDFSPSIRAYVTGITSDSRQVRRILDREKKLALLSFRKEEGKGNLIAVMKYQDIAVLMQRRQLEKMVASAIPTLDGFAVQEGFENFADMEKKVRAAEKRNAQKAPMEEQKAARAAALAEATVTLEQNPAYGSW